MVKQFIDVRIHRTNHGLLVPEAQNLLLVVGKFLDDFNEPNMAFYAELEVRIGRDLFRAPEISK